MHLKAQGRKIQASDMINIKSYFKFQVQKTASQVREAKCTLRYHLPTLL
jgi:hypothetical protein